MDQQQAWDREYQSAKEVPTSTRTRPSSSVKRLLTYIETHRPELGKTAIDLGCGAGRNALFLAEQGYAVTAVDFSQVALQNMQARIQASPTPQPLSTKQVDLTKPLPFADDSFDLALDIVTTMTLQPDELPHLAAEVRRILRPGGLFLSYVLSDDDGVLVARNPGGSSTTIKTSGITDYYLSEQMLREVYHDWRVVVMEKTVKEDIFYGKQYTRRIWWLLLENTK